MFSKATSRPLKAKISGSWMKSTSSCHRVNKMEEIHVGMDQVSPSHVETATGTNGIQTFSVYIFFKFQVFVFILLYFTLL